VETRLDNREVFEVKLGEEFLMSSLFTEAERQLATLGLAPLKGELDVVIGGLGLGYTAAEALKNKSVTRLLVIDLFQRVIDWHRDGLVPNGEVLTKDARCELRQGDFFELARTSFDTEAPERKFDAVLLDLDAAELRGHSLATLCSADPHLSKVPLIILTPLARGADPASWKRLGYAGQVNKPVKQGELGACLASLVGLGPPPVPRDRRIADARFASANELKIPTMLSMSRPPDDH